jgi:hypothetical protein
MRLLWKIVVDDPDHQRARTFVLPRALPYPAALRTSARLAIVCDRRGPGVGEERMPVRDRLYHAVFSPILVTAVQRFAKEA